jgi:hypothetical protein
MAGVWYLALPGHSLNQQPEFAGLSHRFMPERALKDPQGILNEPLEVLEQT